MVIQPEQIAFAAQQEGVATSTQFIDPKAHAATLLARDDNESGWGTQTQVLLVDLASKVVEAYEPWDPGDPQNNPGRIQTQYVQSNCGCGGGGSTQGLKLEYDYFDWTAASVPGRTTRVTERKDPAAGWPLHRYVYHDLQLMGDPPPMGEPDHRVPYMIIKAIVDAADPSLQWVTRYVYDGGTTNNLIRMRTPSAKEAYVPADVTSPNPPIYTAHEDQGLVYAYSYASGELQTPAEVRVREGRPPIGQDNFEDYTVISRTLYHANPDYAYLPVAVERYRDGQTGVLPPGPCASASCELVEYDYGFRTTGGHDIAWVETRVEAESTAENGPGGTFSSYELFDANGNNYWRIAADGSYTKRVFDSDDAATPSMTGRIFKTIRNADTVVDGFPTTGELPPNLPPDRHDAGKSLTTEYVRDLCGRVHIRKSPGLVATHTRREIRTFEGRPNMGYYAEITLPHEISPGAEYDGPVSITWFNADDDVIGSSDYVLGTSGYSPWTADGYYAALLDYDLDTSAAGELARQVVLHDVSGLVTARQVWHDVEDPNAFYTTAYDYDALGRLATTTNAVGTITQNTYDVLDRTTDVDVGTDAGNMTPLVQYVYDGGSWGNGNLTQMTRFIAGTPGDRVTNYVYDFRDRLVFVQNPIAPHEAVDYDNLDRVVHRAVLEYVPTPPEDYDFTVADGLRKRVTETVYGQRGLVVRQKIAIDLELASGARTYLESRSWYDEVGRAVSTWPPNGPRTKTTFDGLGRPSVVYLADGRDLSSATFRDDAHDDVHSFSSHAANVTDDVVFEQTEYRYIDGPTGTHAGMLDLATRRRRTHDATDADTGDLDPVAFPDAKVITTFTGTDYDDADRVIRSINFGTNDDVNQEFVYGGLPPTKTGGDFETDAYDLVTATTYDTRGLVATSTDPDGKATAFLHDDMNRRIAVIENFVDATVGWSISEDRWEVTGGLDPGEPDTDRVTSFVFDGISSVTKQAAHVPGGTPGAEGSAQVTVYTYGVTTTDSPVPSELTSHDLMSDD